MSNIKQPSTSTKDNNQKTSVPVKQEKGPTTANNTGTSAINSTTWPSSKQDKSKIKETKPTDKKKQQSKLEVTL